MSSFSKPKSALKLAEGLINVGQKKLALEFLHDAITWRFRSWEKALERMMLLYVELCVEFQMGNFAKVGLIHYRNVCQHVNVKSLEGVIQKFLNLATERALGKESVLESVDHQRPEDLMLLSYSTTTTTKNLFLTMSGGIKFLFETYITMLEVLKNRSKLEGLYARTAGGAFRFFRQHNRTMEFRRLCETVRNHLAILIKYAGDQRGNRHWPDRRGNRYWPDLSVPKILKLYLDTRFDQLEVAIEFQLWQEAFRCIEDIHGLMSMVRKTLRASLMVVYYAKLVEIFRRSSSHLYHAYAWLKLYTLERSYNRKLSQVDLQLIASSAVLAALSVPPCDDHHTHGVYDLEREKVKNLKMAGIIRFDVDHRSPDSKQVLSRAGLFAELESKEVMSSSIQEVQDLYLLLEQEFVPLDLATKVKPQLAKISELGEIGILSSAPTVPEIHLSQYVPALEKMATLRLLQQVSLVYQTVKIDNLSKMIPFFDDFAAVEKLSVDAAKQNFIAMKFDHTKGAVFFGQQKLQHDGLLLDHLSLFAESLSNARTAIYPPAKKARKLPDLSEVVEEEHQRIVARKLMIEQHKEEQERQLLETKKEEESKRLTKRQIMEKAEHKRLAADYEYRKIQMISRIQMMRQEIDEREKEMSEKKEARRKERQEKEKKFMNLAKKVDYLERAKREESAPLVEAAFQERQVEEAVEIEMSREHDAGEKSRLARTLAKAKIFRERVVGRMEAERNERQDRLNQILRRRKQDRKIQRKIIFYLRSEEEKQKKLLADKEEAKKLEETERQRKEAKYVPPGRRKQETHKWGFGNKSDDRPSDRWRDHYTPILGGGGSRW